MQVWAGPLSRKRVVVVFWNRGSSGAAISVGWREIGLSTFTHLVVRDLWAVMNTNILYFYDIIYNNIVR